MAARLLLLLLPLALTLASTADAAELSIAAYPSIQAALDANPNRVLFVPAGDYPITDAIRIRGDRGGLFGPGRIIQQNADRQIVVIDGATGVEIRDLTLTRPDGSMDTARDGILAVKCRDLVIENVRVLDNRSNAGAITVVESSHCRISRCLVRNYMRVSIDDRTASEDWGYAFNCTDGTGIKVIASTGTLIEGNRVVEDNLLPTPEMKAQHTLGDFVKKNPVKGRLPSQTTWDGNYVNNWQQGSGIIVTSPEVSDLTRILGNHIENAAQGLDIHADHVIVSGNVVVDSFVGMKAMHGSRNVIISGNQFVRNSLWSIGLMPGVAAHAAEDGKPDNADGGSIIANNIVSDFGHGRARWIWGDDNAPFKFDDGQHPDDPPLTDVIVTGNLIHTIGPPRYARAVVINASPTGPRGMHFSNNLFPPGSQGVCNQELPP
jgi:hypothetical protein